MQGCSWIVQVFATFGFLSLVASLVIITIAVMADRADRRAVADPEVEDFGRPIAGGVKSVGHELAERMRAWWHAADLGWIAFYLFVLILGGIVLWIVLEAVNRWDL